MLADTETTSDNLQAMKPISFETLKRKDDADSSGKPIASTSACGTSTCTQSVGTHTLPVLSGRQLETLKYIGINYLADCSSRGIN